MNYLHVRFGFICCRSTLFIWLLGCFGIFFSFFNIFLGWLSCFSIGLNSVSFLKNFLFNFRRKLKLSTNLNAIIKSQFICILQLIIKTHVFKNLFSQVHSHFKLSQRILMISSFIQQFTIITNKRHIFWVFN